MCIRDSDNIFYGQSFSRVLRQAAEREKGATIFGYFVRDPREYGVVEFDENGDVYKRQTLSISFSAKIFSIATLSQISAFTNVSVSYTHLYS